MFHRVEEMEAMPGPRFCALAPLLAAYPGALAARVNAERAEREQGPEAVLPPVSQASAVPALPPGAELVPAIPAALTASEPLADLFSFGVAGG